MISAPPSSSLRRPLALLRLSLGLSLLLASATAALAVELPQVGTPWDNFRTHRVGDEISEDLILLDQGSGEGDPVYSCTGLPPELKLNKTTGTVSGTIRTVGFFSITSRVSVGGLVSPAVTRRIAIMPAYVADPGNYEVSLTHFEIQPLGAHVSLLLQPAGTYSGSLRLGVRTIPLAGLLRPIPGQTAGAEGPHVLIRLPRPEGSRLVQVVVTSDTSRLGIEFRDAATGETIAGNASLILFRPAIGDLPPCPQVGRHNVAFLPNSSPPTTGSAVGVITISPDYRWTFTGQTPHGKGITSSHWCSATAGEGPGLSVYSEFYASDNASTCLYGGLILPARLKGPGPGVQDGVQLLHIPQKGRLIPEGGMEATLTFISSRYDQARALQMFPGGDATFQASALDTAPIPGVLFALNRQLRAIFGTGSANPIKARLDVYAPTGLFTGQFTLTDPDPRNPARNLVRRVSYRGLLLPDHQLGAGNFLLPTLPDPNAQPPTTPATSPIVSGQILVTSGQEN